MATLLVGIVLVLIVALAVRSMIKDRRNGKSVQCGGDCSHCPGHDCH